MALIIEDGSEVDDADSYIDVAYLREYAAKRGDTLPAADPDAEVLLVKAMDFLDAQEPHYQGIRITETQPLSWPRSGAYINGFKVAEDAIPQNLKKAQAQLAIYAVTSDLMPSGTGQIVLRKKVDVLETEFANTGSSTPLPSFTKANKLLQSLYTSGGSGLPTALEHV